jgi:hypothetical protein
MSGGTKLPLVVQYSHSAPIQNRPGGPQSESQQPSEQVLQPPAGSPQAALMSAMMFGGS